MSKPKSENGVPRLSNRRLHCLGNEHRLGMAGNIEHNGAVLTTLLAAAVPLMLPTRPKALAGTPFQLLLAQKSYYLGRYANT